MSVAPEDLAQEALTQWSESGVLRNPGVWLTTWPSEGQLMAGAGRNDSTVKLVADGPRPRFAGDGSPILPVGQDRSRWDRTEIRRLRHDAV